MKKTSRNNRPASLGLLLHGLGLALVVGVTATYYLFVYGKLQAQQASDLQRIDQLAKFLQRSGPVSALHHQLQEDADELHARGEKIRVRLSQPLNGEELAKALHSVAATSGLEISQLTMDNATSVASHRQNDLQLHCSRT